MLVKHQKRHANSKNRNEIAFEVASFEVQFREENRKLQIANTGKCKNKRCTLHKQRKIIPVGEGVPGGGKSVCNFVSGVCLIIKVRLPEPAC